MKPILNLTHISVGGLGNEGSLVTINEVATYFGTDVINDEKVYNAVIQYDYTTDKWNRLESTVSSRRDQTVVVIPESWLCKHTGQPSHVIFINIFILIFYETNLLIHVFNADRIL